MKKIISIVFVLILSALVLCSCGKKTEATKNVENMINALADIKIGIDSGEQIAEAESAYNALSDEEKAKVKNYNKLEKAKEELASVQAKYESFDEMNSVIEKIIDAANTRFSTENTDYAELLSQAQDILDNFNKLSDEEKKNVNVSDELNEAIEALNAYTSSAEKSTAAYVKAFNEVYADEKYEVTAVYCIKQIRDATEYHIFALTYKDKNGEEHNVYANARCSANTTAQTIISNAETFFSENAVSDDYNAVIGGNIDLNLEKVLELAK
ncbi:MAG: hypothetical protein J1E34_08365 [Oscillospiraceae bacterium]|nr:hypothetical protein [Oscillospiraceae bacterium]